MKKISFLLLALIAFSMSMAQDQPYKSYGIENSTGNLPQGLNPGEIAPNFILKDIDAKAYELSASLKNPIVLIFYRGNWCGQCNKYLSRIQDSLKYIQQNGAQLWAITPQSVENAEIMKNKRATTFPILSDVDENVMIAYDVMFKVTKAYQNKVSFGKLTSISKHNNQEEANLPVPATFIIDKNQKIVYRHFDYDYSKRASVQDILKALSDIE